MMDIKELVLAGILAAFFLPAGFIKLIKSRDKLIAQGGTWAEDVSARNIKFIGIAEIVMAISILPFFGLFSFMAAIGMGITMGVAAFIHIRKKEIGLLFLTLLLASMAFYLTYQNISRIIY